MRNTDRGDALTLAMARALLAARDPWISDETRAVLNEVAQRLYLGEAIADLQPELDRVGYAVNASSPDWMVDRIYA